MRIRKGQEEQATRELLSKLSMHPEGLATTEMSGTKQFHGVKTLRNPQIIRLLGRSGKAEMTMVGGGNYWKCVWKLKTAE
jgi:uncharacterized protein